MTIAIWFLILMASFFAQLRTHKNAYSICFNADHNEFDRPGLEIYCHSIIASTRDWTLDGIRRLSFA